MVHVKNKNKMVIVINNNTNKRRGARRRNPLSKSQETIIRHQYFNTPVFNPIVPNQAPTGTRISEAKSEAKSESKSDTDRDKEIAKLRSEVQELYSKFPAKKKAVIKNENSRYDPDIFVIPEQPKISDYFRKS